MMKIKELGKKIGCVALLAIAAYGLHVSNERSNVQYMERGAEERQEQQEFVQNAPVTEAHPLETLAVFGQNRNGRYLCYKTSVSIAYADEQGTRHVAYCEPQCDASQEEVGGIVALLKANEEDGGSVQLHGYPRPDGDLKLLKIATDGHELSCARY